MRGIYCPPFLMLNSQLDIARTENILLRMLAAS
jgi:hypothetical protein